MLIGAYTLNVAKLPQGMPILEFPSDRGASAQGNFSQLIVGHDVPEFKRHIRVYTKESRFHDDASRLDNASQACHCPNRAVIATELPALLTRLREKSPRETLRHRSQPVFGA